MVSNVVNVNNNTITIKDMLKQLKALVSRAEFIETKTELSQPDKLILRFRRVLMDPSSHYFCPEAKLFISSQYIGYADVVRIMDERGEHLSRSGCENRIMQSGLKFITDFGPDAVQILLSEVPLQSKSVRLSELELKLLSIENGVDYTDNTIDNLLKKHGIVLKSVDGFASTANVTPEQVDRFISIIEPYTPKGIERRKKELKEVSDVLWYFRKATVDSTNDAVASYILRNII